jgi:hypothetical protein
MSPIVVVSAVFLGRSENFEKKRDDLVSNKFHKPLIVITAEASEGLFIQVLKNALNFSSVKSQGR